MKKISHEFEGDWGGTYGSKGKGEMLQWYYDIKKKLNKYQKSSPRSPSHDIYTRYTTNQQLSLQVITPSALH